MAIERLNGASNSCTVVGTSGNRVILLSTGTYEHKGSYGRLEIRKSVIIQGSGGDYTHSIITGDPSWGGGVFDVPYGLTENVDVTLQYLEIKNSKDTDVDGSAVRIEVPASGYTYNTTLDTVRIDNCTSWQGGAVLNTGGTLTIKNSYFHDNHAAYGGAIATLGSNTYLDVSLSQFENNAADQTGTFSQGGAIQASGNGSVATSTFNNNRSSGNGGAFAGYGTGSLWFHSSVFYGNTAVNGGGASEASPFALTLENSTVSGNTASSNGGGIFANGYLQLFSDTIANNRALGGAGGGVYQGSASSSRTSACIVALNTRGSTYQRKDDFSGVPHGNSGDGRSLFSSRVPFFTHGGYPDLVVSGFTLPALADNGGPTKTHAITASSEAYNADRDSPGTGDRAADQRSANVRPRAGFYDLGAFEL